MKDIFILLLQKKFSGEITPAETEQLETWLRQSPEHAREALVLEQIWERSEGYALPFEPDLDADFTALQARIHQEEVRPATKVVSLWPALARVAAAVAFLFLAYWGWQYRSRMTAPTVATALLEKSNRNAEKQLLLLADGSRVWLREGAQLRYPAAFDRDDRTVHLTGEAYFEVSHRPEQPFRVQLAEGRMVEVLGTEFNVRAEPNSAEVSVLVRSGKVRFAPTAQSAGTVLTAGQKAVFDPVQSQIRVGSPTTLNELAWQTGRLEFVKTPLAQALLDIEACHGVRVALRNAALRQCQFTSVLNQGPPEQLLKTVAAVFNLTLEKKDAKTFVLSGGRCK